MPPEPHAKDASWSPPPTNAAAAASIMLQPLSVNNSTVLHFWTNARDGAPPNESPAEAGLAPLPHAARRRGGGMAARGSEPGYPLDPDELRCGVPPRNFGNTATPSLPVVPVPPRSV